MRNISSFFKTRNITYISLMAGFAALIGMGALAFENAQNYRDRAISESQSGILISKIRNLLVVMVDAETAERGYVITQRKDFLAPFERTQVRLADVYEILRKDTEDNPEHQARMIRLKDLIDREMKVLTQSINLVKAGNSEAAAAMIRQGDGKRFMDEIRVELKQMEGQEEATLREIVEKNQKLGDKLNATMYIFLTLVLVLMGLAVSNMISDIRRRTETERELLLLKEKAVGASEMKSHFLANMSHEIRTPLNGIHGMVSLLEQTDLSSEQKEYVDTLQESSVALLALINDILDLSKIEAGRLEFETTPFAPREVMDAVVKVLTYSAQHKNVQLQVFEHGTIPSVVLGDSLRLRQILMNLIGNAIKFSSQGTVQLHMHLKDMQGSRARLRFEVVDEGVGITEETKKKLFKNFSQADSSTTRQYGGTGLGLSICRQLVELMGGEIDAFQNPDKGATFWFELPYDISSTRISAAKEHTQLKVISFGDKKPLILVVEDHIVNQKVVSNLLGKIGCDCKMANNGVEALEILAREKFDLILMDCHMPKLDGYETAAAIRSGKNVLQPDIPIIAATANVIKGEKEKCLAVGMNDYVSKPMALDELQSKIAKWLSQSAPAEKESQPLINPAALQKMNELNDEDEDLYRDIVKIFIDTFPKDLAEMREMLSKSEYLDLSERAHRVKSTCNHLGITSMSEICLFIEHNSFPKNCTVLRKGLDDLEGLYQKALVEFQKLPKAG